MYARPYRLNCRLIRRCSPALAAAVAMAAHPGCWAQAAVNTAYVEVNSNALANVGCFVRSDKPAQPFFSKAVIFAANIKGDSADDPWLYFNPQVTALLDTTQQVKALQDKGIAVLLGVLGGTPQVGWSCVVDPLVAKKLADQFADAMQRYGLDGIDIDDEYAKCTPNPQSILMIADAPLQNPKFRGKSLSKALHADLPLFRASYNGRKMTEVLSFAAAMSYWAPAVGRLKPYLAAGMDPARLAVGISTSKPFSDNLPAILQGYSGNLMVFTVTKDSEAYLSAAARLMGQAGVKAVPGCLR